MRRKLGDRNGASLVREAYPRHILFEKQDGLYFLRGKDLAQASSVLGLECSETVAGVAVDSMTLSLYIVQLAGKGLPVGILQQNTVQVITAHKPKASSKVPSTPIGLAPKLLLGQKELDRLQRSFSSRHSSFRDRVQRLRNEWSNGHGMSLKDLGPIYVYQVDVDLYEVDWQLTSITPAAFEAVALATHQAGQLLNCRLVAPKATRGKNGSKPKVLISVSEPLAYGQLRLAI